MKAPSSTSKVCVTDGLTSIGLNLTSHREITVRAQSLKDLEVPSVPVGLVSGGHASFA